MLLNITTPGLLWFYFYTVLELVVVISNNNSLSFLSFKSGSTYLTLRSWVQFLVATKSFLIFYSISMSYFLGEKVHSIKEVFYVFSIPLQDSTSFCFCFFCSIVQVFIPRKVKNIFVAIKIHSYFAIK